MNGGKSTASRLERWIIGILDAVLLVLIVVWVANCHLFQIVFIGAAFALGLLAVLSLAAWRHGFRWFFTRRALRFYGWLVVGIISVIVLFYAEENWRGKRAWAALQREAAARGESLELSSVFPPPVPDNENFALAPGVARLFGYEEPEPGQAQNPSDFRRENLPFFHGESETWPPANWAFQQATDLAAWQKFFRQPPSSHAGAADSGHTDSDHPRLQFPVASEPQAPAADVLLALSRYDSALAVLRAASQRPKTRYPLDYERGLFGLMRGQYFRTENFPAAAHVLCLRAVAELASDQREAALRDILLALRLADSLRPMPYESLHRARAEMLMFCLQPVWEGLARHRWNEPQLAKLQQQFAALDLIAEFGLAARGETLVMMNLADQLEAFLDGRRSPAADQMRSARGDDLLTVWLFRLFYPTGWLYQDKVWLYRFYERRSDVFKILETRPWRHFSAECRRATDPFLLIFVVPRLKEIYSGDGQALFVHTACQQAAVACALERYRLAHGQYPDSLEALVPFLLKQVPADLLARSGTPLVYRRDAGGGFLLYSIGLNRQDDGGKPSPAIEYWHRSRPYQALFPRLTEGDWVWCQPGQ
jgi:hypothetical protein